MSVWITTRASSSTSSYLSTACFLRTILVSIHPSPPPFFMFRWPGSHQALHQSLPDLLRNLLRNPVEPDLALHQSLPDFLRNPVEPDLALHQGFLEPSPEPSELSLEPRWTWAILGWRPHWLTLLGKNWWQHDSTVPSTSMDRRGSCCRNVAGWIKDRYSSNRACCGLTWRGESDRSMLSYHIKSYKMSQQNCNLFLLRKRKLSGFLKFAQLEQ